jgi:hypothetical protein
LNSGLCTCKAGALLLQPHRWSTLLWLFWRWGFLRTICPSWPRTTILLTSASQVARITGYLVLCIPGGCSLCLKCNPLTANHLSVCSCTEISFRKFHPNLNRASLPFFVLSLVTVSVCIYTSPGTVVFHVSIPVSNDVTF